MASPALFDATEVTSSSLKNFTSQKDFNSQESRCERVVAKRFASRVTSPSHASPELFDASGKRVISLKDFNSQGQLLDPLLREQFATVGHTWIPDFGDGAGKGTYIPPELYHKFH
eukprot:6937535-Karenia_brevis.AAC.1